MTAPFSHDDIFEDIRRNGPDMPADATAVGTSAPKTTIREYVRQTMRGLGRSGINTVAMAPEFLTAMAFGGTDPVIGPHVIRPFVEHYFTKPQLEELDEYWGRPETSGGRGAALLSELAGSAALTGSVLPRRGPPGATLPRQQMRPIPGSGGRGFEMVGYSPTPPPPTAPTLFEILSGTAPKRTVPEVRPPTPGEMKKITDAMRRAPPESREARLLRDLAGEPPQTADDALRREMLKSGDWGPDYFNKQQVPDDIDDFVEFMVNNVSPREFVVDQGIMGRNTLDDLLNLRAFGSRRGPFSTSGKTNMQIMDDLGQEIGPVNPIASADEVAAVNSRAPSRLDITEQMRDPDMMSGKAAQQEIGDMRVLQERVNEALREDIITEGIPAHARTKMAPRIFDVLMGQPSRRSMPSIPVKSVNPLSMLLPAKYRKG